MLKSHHLFKVAFLIFLFLGHAYAVEQAAFRVQDRAFYISDMNQYIDDLNSFTCLKPKSLFMKALGYDSKRIESLGNKQVEIKSKKSLFDLIVNIVILSRFVQEREKGKLPHFKAGRCFKKEMSYDLKGLLRTEIFLQDRFKRRGKAVDLKTIRMFIAGLRKKTDHEIFE